MNVTLSRRTATNVMGLSKAARQSRGPTVSYFSTKWSGNLSFASPEADFVSTSNKILTETSKFTVSNFSSDLTNTTWSRNLSFSAPESDFVSASPKIHLGTSASTVSCLSSNQTNASWSESLSFATPESDYVSAPKEVHAGSSKITIPNSATNGANRTWSESLSFASPESDFVFVPDTSMSERIPSGRGINMSSILQELFQHHYLYLSPETATGSIAYNEMLDEATKDIIALQECLPTTIEDALNDERPVIITNIESPFLVVDVNGAWEGLCGYHRDEAIGRNIGSLLQGPETDIETADNAIRSLRENGFSEAVLTNYTKNGRKFKNHLKIGMIPAAGNIHDSSSSDDSYFVGVLYDMDRQINEKPEKTVSL